MIGSGFWHSPVRPFEFLDNWESEEHIGSRRSRSWMADPSNLNSSTPPPAVLLLILVIPSNPFCFHNISPCYAATDARSEMILDKQTSSHDQTVLVRLHICYLETGIKILREQQAEFSIGCAFRLLCARFEKEQICEGGELRRRRMAKEEKCEGGDL